VRLSDDIVLPVPQSRAARYRSHLDRDGLTFGLRPEHLTEAKTNGEKALGYIDAVLEVTEPLGMETLVFFRIKGVDVCGRVSPNAGAREGIDPLVQRHDERRRRQVPCCLGAGRVAGAGSIFST